MLGEAAKRKLEKQRLRIKVRGAVQGVGFRPFVYRLATSLELFGSVNNSPDGVTIEVEGPREQLHSFLLRLSQEKPPRSFIQSLESSWLDPSGHSDFVIGESGRDGAKTAIVLPDIGTCPDCLSDVFDPEDRRYRYPFTNCTNCGPRYSIIRSLPYDRANTTMAAFEMCDACRAEYEDPMDRRFHAQPNACPDCGPQLALWDGEGKAVASRDTALIGAADAIRDGAIVAIKGLGGFHLVCDAGNDKAVRELRRRKHREEKPLALMSPSIENVLQFCHVSSIERSLLTSPEAPIVLLRAKEIAPLSPLIAPRNPYLGVMLPYTPLHHLLMHELQFPVVATSGNLSDEPICIDEREAVERLAGIADVFLVHNRPIERQVDDSIVRVMMRREAIVRRARGYAPLPFRVEGGRGCVVAAGAHQKNTVTIAVDDQAYLSQHIGDLETPEACAAFDRVTDDIERLYDVQPRSAACDLHPDYVSTKWASGSGLETIPVQHHYAHILSCMAENEVAAPCLGVAWDGTGYGTDGTIWGGEFLTINDVGFERAGHLRTFRLPGGDKAMREPRRSALGLLYELLGDKVFDRRDLFPVVAFSDAELRTIKKMLAQDINSPVTSSAGRLFDAVASILGLRERVAFEGQAAMELEFCSDPDETGCYNFELAHGGVLDWEPMLRELVSDIDSGGKPRIISAKFHNTLVAMISSVASDVGHERVVLSGGCFQNRYLLEHTADRLTRDGFRVYWHQRVPTNDGGISLGQAAAVARLYSKKEEPICA
ncbi:MAG TPA: carbamoyltransferase HypF [Pyrinomonadaceae bacterium]|nr:carbamoyltransferase HypF [Pyrinomonadaceae bacterium]